MAALNWTLVSRDKGGHFFRPVLGAPVTDDWWVATVAAEAMGELVDHEQTAIWYVCTEESQHRSARAMGTDEDLNNILDHDGKRRPIRWDAKARHQFPADVTMAQLEARASERKGKAL